MEACQIKALLEKRGACIDVRYEPKYTVYLYRLPGQHFEAFYHNKFGFVKARGLENMQASLVASAHSNNLLDRIIGKIMALVGLPH